MTMAARSIFSFLRAAGPTTEAEAEAKPPMLLEVRSAKWFIIMTICMAVFTDIFLYAVIVPVIPFALVVRVGVDQEEVQYWISVLLSVYSATLLAFSPLAGWLADRSPTRRLPLLVALLALAASTVLLCFGTSVSMLIAGRALQGISAAAVWAIGLALLVDTVGQKDIGQAMGYVSLSMSASTMLAPLLGGVVYARVGYYAVYYMTFGLTALDIVLRILMIEKKVARQWVREEERPIPEAPVDSSHGAESEPKLSPAVPHSTAVLGTNERAPEAPQPEIADGRVATKRSRLPPVLTLLASRRLLAALWEMVVLATIMTSFDTVLPLRVSLLFGWDSIGAGLVFLSLIVPSLAAPLIGKASDKYGPRWFAATGFLVTCPLFVCLRFVDHGGIRQIVLLCALLTLIGTAIIVVFVPIMAEVTYTVAAKEQKNPHIFGPSGAYAQAYGLFNTAYAAGCIIGPLWSGFINDRAGWGTMSWSLGLLAAFTSVPTLLWAGGFIVGGRRKREVGRGAPGTSSV